MRFICCDQPQANDLTIQILAAVAEDEAKRTSERTKAALAAAKARGVRLGGDRCGIAQYSTKGAAASAALRSDKAAEWSADLVEVVESIKAEGATSLRAIAAELNAREFTTPRGGVWAANQVKRVLDRAQATDG